MFSREQSKVIRKQFWIFFGKRYPRKWLLYNTGIKDFALKFDFNTTEATVALESTATDEIDRLYYFDKIVSLKTLLKEEVSTEMIFNSNYQLDNGKMIARAYLTLPDVNIHNKNHWPEVFEFFHTYMSKLEAFYITYEDFIKS